MVKNFTLLSDPSASPLSSSNPLSTSSLLNKLPANALAEQILNDPEVWNILSDDVNSVTGLRLPLDSSIIKEEITWLENEVKALNSPQSPFAEYSAHSQRPNTTVPCDTDPLRLESRRTRGCCETIMVMESMWRERRSSKTRSSGVSSPCIHDPCHRVNKPKHKNDGKFPQFSACRMLTWLLGSDWRARPRHVPVRRAGTTRPLMRTAHGTEPMCLLSSPSYESHSDSGLSSGCAFYLSDDRTMMVWLISLGQGPLSLSSSYTSFFSPSNAEFPKMVGDRSKRPPSQRGYTCRESSIARRNYCSTIQS
jgi:hypothetical protein